MAATNALALPIPELTQLADGPDAFSDLANAVEDYFYDRITPAGVTRTPTYYWGAGTTPPDPGSTAGLQRGDTYWHTGQGVLLDYNGTAWRQAAFPPPGADSAGYFVGQYRDHATYGLQRWDGTAWGDPSPQPTGQWITPTLLTGVTVPSGYRGAQYRKIGDVVELRGICSALGAATPTNMFQLPVGYRPTARDVYSSVRDNSDVVRFDILTDGTVQRYQTAVTGVQIYISLNGFQFSTLA